MGTSLRIKLSGEQQLFIEKALQGENILVDACIGSGKTTAIQSLCNELPSTKKVLYLTYNKLLKLDAKSKIKKRNVKVTNYHGFAYMVLSKCGVSVGISDLIQTFIKEKPFVGQYDILIIDEYQDIEQELAELLQLVKDCNQDAWEFILDQDVLQSETNYHMLCHIAKIVNEGFFYDGGRIRGVPVAIGSSSYIPPLPVESVVKERIAEIVGQGKTAIDVAIELCLYCMKTQMFLDGNKRVSVIFANHYLIAHGMGVLVIPEKEVSEFKKILVAFYEGKNTTVIYDFMKERCWKNF